MAADINGDGALDLAVTGASANQIEVLPGDANTSLGWSDYLTYSTGSYPIALVAADFNGDGRVDLAVVNQVDSTVSILLGGPPSQISCSPSTLAFEATAPGQNQLSQICAITTTVSTLNLVNIDPENMTWLRSSLSYGQGPRTLTVLADGSSRAPGTYNGDIELWDQSTDTDVKVPVTLTIDQSVCSYTLSATSAVLPAGGGSGSFDLTNGRLCSATPSSDASWLTVTADPAETSPNVLTTQTINYSATANLAAALRTAHVTVGPQTFTVTQSGVSLQVTSVTPASGSGSSQAFSFQFVDSSGPTGMTANMWFTGAYGADYSASCFIYYSNSQLFLFNDDGLTTTQSALGTAGSLANDQCSVDTGSAAAVWSGNNLTINLTVTFLPAFAGQLQTWMDINTASADTGWFQEGSWTATAPPNIVSVVSVKPCCNTSGAFQNFVFRYADSSGAANIQTVWFWFTPSYNNGNAAHTCQAYYNLNYAHDQGSEREFRLADAARS